MKSPVTSAPIALCLGALLLLAAPAPAAPAARLELKPGDHLCLIGNALAERMQHDNQWEARLHQRFPRHNLVVRNLAFSADEVDFKTEFVVQGTHSNGDKASRFRPRSRDFGPPDQHLKHSQADVVLAFFGFNESFAGPAGLPKFKADLETLITHTRAQNYSGRGPARLALVSPIAHEDLGHADFPDGQANNANLKLYTQAMAELAAKHGVPFVDLFAPTQMTFAWGMIRHTINGVHLNADGHRAVALLLDEGLFGRAGATDSPNAPLRAEIAEKNYQWFMRYRAVNGYYIYGGRSRLKFSDGVQTNADVMERERKILDEMCANRDARIWKVAQGQPVPAAIDDSNASPFLPVKTHFGAGRVDRAKSKEGSAQARGMSSKTAEADELTYLTTAEALARFKVAPGYAVNCFASEEQFPEIANAVQLSFDARGRLWVCTMVSYPQYQPLKDTLAGKSRPDDKLVILEDTDRDGKADKSTIFARGLHVPTGFEFANGGVYVAQQPDLLFLRDTDGDDRADVFERVLHGFDSADSHHSISAFTLGPGGDLYFQEGTFFYSQVETPYGPVRNHNACVFRFEPRTSKLDVFVSYAFANPWGISFDRWGQIFIADASGGANYFGTAFSGRTIYPDKHRELPQWIKMRVRPTSGGEFVASRHFPPEAQGNYLLNNCIGVQGVLQHRVTEKDSGFVGTEIEPLLLSDDANFRPVDLEFGPDGALYLVDWHEPLIGHMQYSLRDPLRDKTHGRIYRVSYPARPLLTPPVIAGAPIGKLLDLLKEPEDRVRTRAKIELGGRPVAPVIAALGQWVSALNPTDAEHPHHLLEALWVYQTMNTVNEPLLRQLLASPEPRARAAAARVLCYWRDRVADPLGTLKKLVGDAHPRVRLEAVRALSFFDTSKAAEIALESLNQPQDQYLKYALDETMRTLERFK